MDKTVSKVDVLPYACTLILNGKDKKLKKKDNTFPKMINDKDETAKVTQFINQIDSPAKLARYSLSLHFGIDGTLSKNFLKYVEKISNGFCDYIQKTASGSNWEISLLFEIRSGYSQGGTLWSYTFRMDKSDPKELFKK